MNIVLRILVILTLVLNGVALWFATALYGKRNLLIDRNMAFRDFAVAIAKTFEAEEPVHENTAANHEARDISDVTLAAADITPDKSDFWESYKEELEKIDGKRYSIDARARGATDELGELGEVYVLDAEGKPVTDGLGRPVKEGAPMDILLREIQEKALAQYKRLNTVRGELSKVRTELEDTIKELNTVKKQGRESLKTIAEKEEQIAGLEADKSRLEGEVTNLKGEIASLEEQKATLQADLDKANEELETAKAEIEKLKKTIETHILTGKGTDGSGSVAVANVTAGVKGKIVRVDNEYNFCLVTLSDDAFVELVGENGERPLPEIEYLVRHPGKEDGIVGKIRLRTLTKDTKTIVCDILAGWKQGEFAKGDEVFYLD